MVLATEPLTALRINFPPKLRLGDADIVELSRLNPDLRLEQEGDGALIVMAPTGGESGSRNIRLAARLSDWADANGTGVAFDSSAGFRLPVTEALRSPDVSWMRRERWLGLPRADREGYAPVCPDFVLELRSPSDRLANLHEKLREYMANGAQLGWLLDPDTRTVWVYRPDQAEPEVVHDATHLSGGPVLPDFVLDLEPVWRVPGEEPTTS